MTVKEIKISLPVECKPDVTPAESKTVIVPYEEYKSVNIYEYLDTVYDFKMGRADSTSDVECPVDRLYIYPEASGYPSTAENLRKTIVDWELQLSEDTQGPNKYIFAMGSSTNLEQSGVAIDATLMVCGKESLELKDSAGFPITITKGGAAVAEYTDDDYSQWFEFNANTPDSDDGCGLIDKTQYQI